MCEIKLGMEWFSEIEFDAYFLFFHLCGETAERPFIVLRWESQQKLFLEVSGNGYFAFLHILGIGQLFLAGIETSNEVFVWSVHADKESAGAEYAVVLFIYEITG